MQSNNTLRFGALVTASTLFAASQGHAQDRPVVLNQLTDILSLNDEVLDLDHGRVTDGGDHIYIATTNEMFDRDRVVIYNGSEVLRKLDVLPGGFVVEDILGADLSNSGEILLHLTLDDAPGDAVQPEALLFQGQPFFWEGRIIESGGLGAGSEVDEIQFAQINDQQQVLVRCVVYNTNSQTTEGVLVRYDLDASGSVLVEDILIQEPNIPVGQTVELNAFSTGETRAEINNSGEFVWCGTLKPAAGAEDGIVYHNLDTLIWQSATPSIVAGRDWGDFNSAPVALNNSGSWAALLHLDSSNLSNQALIAVDGNVVLQEGDALPFDPLETIQSFSFLPVCLSDTGEVIYYARWGAPGSQDEGLFCDNQAISLPGVTQTASGETIDLIAQDLEALRISDDGNRILYKAFLDNGNLALLLAQRNIGTSYCSATTNSTGQASVTTAAGSTDASLNALRLTTSGMPLNEFGLFITSQTQDFIPMPGNSVGHLCVGGTIGRFISQISNSGSNGRVSIWVDLNNIPVLGGAAVQPGETWNFQTWHRDLMGLGSNFSLPLEITFD